MGRMPSNRRGSAGGAAADKSLLKDVAHRAIRHGLAHGRPLDVDVPAYPASLHGMGASFVTLKREGELRGCLGSLEARRPLVQDVAHNAYAAAFRDPRFTPLGEDEYNDVTVSIALLSAAEPVACSSETELVGILQPGIDGLILEEGSLHRATFLPAVWDVIRCPEEFVRQLKIKAGLPSHYWSDTLRVRRYTTELIC